MVSGVDGAGKALLGKREKERVPGIDACDYRFSRLSTFTTFDIHDFRLSTLSTFTTFDFQFSVFDPAQMPSRD